VYGNLPGSACKEYMKKPFLAILGLAGACAACCSLPIALTLVGGLSTAGFATWILGNQTAQLAVAGLGALLVIGIVIWRASRASPSRENSQGMSCTLSPTAKCGCASTSKAA